MTNAIVTPNPTSYAFQFGQQDAKEGAAFAPESWFVSPSQQAQYSFGFESVAGVTFATSQFTGSELPKPIAPVVAPKNNERIRKTDNASFERITSLDAKRHKRVEALLAATLEFCPNFVAA